MALKNLTRIRVGGNSARPKWALIGDDGLEVEVYTEFDRHLDEKGYRGRTKKRYAEAAARFIDYLIECGVVDPPTTAAAISLAVKTYPLFLRDGARFDDAKLPGLASYAREIGMLTGIAAGSFAPALAGVNQFLTFARDLALRRLHLAERQGVKIDGANLAEIFSAIEGTEAWSAQERANFKMASVMGAVVRISHHLERPRGLRAPVKGGQQVDLENKEFPLEHLADLLCAATCRRDRAFWLLLAGGGLRFSEGLVIRVTDVDPRRGEVWVVDPDSLRFGRSMLDSDRIRFKGRTMSRVYLYEPLASMFWEELQAYLRDEFVPTDEHDFLFQKLDSVGRGQPLCEASDTAVEGSFKRAVVRAGVPGPSEAPKHIWTLHSLRHAYGVYMLNHLPVPGGPGLRLSEVQQLMGHASIESTKKYARHDRRLLEARIELADQIVFGEVGSGAEAIAKLPTLIANRLRDIARQIDGGDLRRLEGFREEADAC